MRQLRAENLRNLALERREERGALEKELKKLRGNVEELETALTKATKTLQLIERDSAWVKQGMPQDMEDFIRTEMKRNPAKVPHPKVVTDLLEETMAAKTKLSKEFDQKVVSKIEEAEKSYSLIIDRRNNIFADKQAILDFMSKLETEKAERLNSCFESVNKSLGRIFSTLLPSAAAWLEKEVDNKDRQGARLAVSFNGQEKTSLSELSGGQRSLLALSFILALLKFKPAPLYILDEVDAALDLSHTQNLGKLIHEQFSSSQFLVISLKPNLFSNADVVYRTELVAGSSQIFRCESGEATKWAMEKDAKSGKAKKRERINA